MEVILTVQAEVTGPVRHETLMGRSFRVVPAVLVKGQVLNNNLGKTFLPPEEITQAWADEWNGAWTIVGAHPTLHGRAVSARQPPILDARAVGHVFNPAIETIDNSKRLTGEVWIEEARAEAVDGLPPVIENLDNGTPVELSTGFPCILEQRAGNFNDREYDLVLHPTGVDHLTISTQFTGACSVADGCGLGVNEDATAQAKEEARMADSTTLIENEEEEVVNVLAAARTPQFRGTEDTAWSSPTLATYVHALHFENISKVSDLSAAQKRQIAVHTLLGDPGGTTLRDISFFPVVNPQTGKLNARALRAVLSGRGSQANISAAAKTSAQNKARSLLHAEFNSDNWEEDAMPMGLWSRFVRLFRVKDKDTALSLSGESDRQFEERLEDALEASLGVNNIIVTDVFSTDGKVVYWIVTDNGPDPGGDSFYQMSFSEAADGAISLSGPPVRVRRRVTYVPADGASGGGAAGAGRGLRGGVNSDPGDATGNLEDAMDRQTMITQLTEKGVLSQETLATLSDCALTGLHKGAMGNAGTAEGAEASAGNASAEGKTSEQEGAAAGTAATAGNDDLVGAIKALTESVNTLREQGEKQAATIAALEKVTAPAVAEQEARKTALIEELGANQRVAFTKDELAGMSFESLEKIRATARGVSYAAVGLPGAAGNAGEQAQQYAPITNYWEEPAEKSAEQEA